MCYYRPQRSCGQGNVFTGVCLSTGGDGGRVSASVHAGMPDPRDQADTPPGTRQTPPGTRQTPPDQADPSGPGRPPRTRQTPPNQADPPRPGRPPWTRQTPPPPGKQTPAYGLRAAGTHPTGMHSCLLSCVPYTSSKIHAQKRPVTHFGGH